MDYKHKATPKHKINTHYTLHIIQSQIQSIKTKPQIHKKRKQNKHTLLELQKKTRHSKQKKEEN